MIRDVITDIDKLTDFCDDVNIKKENELVRSTILDLKDTINELGVNALAAPQIGVTKRIVVLKFGKNDLRTFINPMIDNASKNVIMSREKCPSIPGKEYIVPRHASIGLMYQTLLGKAQGVKLNGLAAVVMQEALQHLEGVLLSSYGLDITDLDWDSSTEDERAEVLKLYIESLDLKQKEIEKEIQENKDLKQISDAIDFMESVRKGETKIKVE